MESTKPRHRTATELFGLPGDHPIVKLFNGKEKTWSQVASEVFAVATFFFYSFRDTLFTCFPSTHLSDADVAIQKTVPGILGKWFPEKIVFSPTIDPETLKAGLNDLEEDQKAQIFKEYFKEDVPENLTVESFVHDHVLKLETATPKKVTNPIQFAFWLHVQDLARDIETLEISVRDDLIQKVAEEKLTPTAFAAHCQDNMHLFKHHLEQLLD